MSDTSAADEPTVAASAYSQFGADTCLTCHADESTALLFRGTHGQRRHSAGPFGAQQLQCEACHGPGGAHARRPAAGQARPAVVSFGAASATPPETQNAMCVSCHRSTAQHEWSGSSHERAAVPCSSCHQVHASADPVLARVTQPEVCLGCHARQRHEFALPHAHPVRQGKMACTDCHGAHGTTNEWDLVRLTVNDTCVSCHAAKRGPFLWEHPPVVERCTNCHQAHGGVHPALLTQRAPFLCQQCHAQTGHPSIARGPDELAGAGPSPYLLAGSCINCHSQVHGSNHPSGEQLTR
ncbi:MAG: DmsE family decaheme c-type cytochrome [Proteobacteria bacterium]|nr:DmsE family decaheme c-type cytochrome [Pseudomonadota bacterium]